MSEPPATDEPGVADWPDLPADEVACLRWLVREGEVTVEQTAAALQVDACEALRRLDALVARKLAQRIEERLAYVAAAGRRATRFKAGGLWDSLGPRLID